MKTRTTLGLAVLAMAMSGMAAAANSGNGRNPGNDGPRGPAAGGAYHESSVAQPSGGEMPADAMPEFSAQGCYDWWWITGDHTYSWKWALLYSKASISGKSYTRYGTSTGPCDVPLVVDRLEVHLETVSRDVTAPKARASRTLSNASYVEASDTDERAGWKPGIPCGGRGLHIASKSGVTWKVSTYSDCGSDPTVPY